MLFEQCSTFALIYSLNLVKLLACRSQAQVGLKFPLLTTEDSLSVKKQLTFQNAATGFPRNDVKNGTTVEFLF